MNCTLKTPRILISGLSGGSGKTFVSLALSRVWTRQNTHVIPFKKGPDYIDPAWLSLACAKPCYCLDPFFLNDEDLKNHFIQSFQQSTLALTHNTYNRPIALIEGNRGLYDGKDVQGTCSSAHLAKLLDCPVIVSINCKKMTRTVAALIMGMQAFDKNVNIAGVILNNTGSARHAQLVQECVETYSDIPVLGVLPRMRNNPIPERHMGLHLHKQNSQDNVLNSIADFFAEHIDVEKIKQIAYTYEDITPPVYVNKHTHLEKIHEEINDKTKQKTKHIKQQEVKPEKKLQHTINIAYIYDDALWFYYEENLNALKAQGASLIPLSILEETSFEEQVARYFSKIPLSQNVQANPAQLKTRSNNINNNNKINNNSSKTNPIDIKIPIHGLYIGGGFPELYAKDISLSPHLKTLKTWIENDLPVYAECGGFMLLSKALHIPQQSLPTRDKHKETENYSELQKTHQKDSDKNTHSHAKIRFNMAHIFEAETEFFIKPQGLGYIIARTLSQNPFHPLHSIWHGHEFHFSKNKASKELQIENNSIDNNILNNNVIENYVLGLKKGHGMQKNPLHTNSHNHNTESHFIQQNEKVSSNIQHTDHEKLTLYANFEGLDGLLYKQCFASYAHLFAPAVPSWAYHFANAAKSYKEGKKYIAQ